MTLVSSAIGIGGTIIMLLLAFTVPHTWGWRYGAFIAGLGLDRYRHSSGTLCEAFA